MADFFGVNSLSGFYEECNFSNGYETANFPWKILWHEIRTGNERTWSVSFRLCCAQARL
jgi:hypothetical protein